MDIIKIGRNIIVKWTLIGTDGAAFPLENYNIELFYATGRGKSKECDPYSLTRNDNVVTWTFRDFRQVSTGVYDLFLCLKSRGKAVAVLEKKEAFILSLTSGIEDVDHLIEIESTCGLKRTNLFSAIYGVTTFASVVLAHSKDNIIRAVNQASGIEMDLFKITEDLMIFGSAQIDNNENPSMTFWTLDSDDVWSEIPVSLLTPKNEVFIRGGGENSIVQKGANNIATGLNAIASGSSSSAPGIVSHAEGYSTSSSGEASHSEGSQTSAPGTASHSEGMKAEASGDFSHAENNITQALGKSTHAEGTGTKANGVSAHAEGYYTNTQNRGEHAEGNYNVSHKQNLTFGNPKNTLCSVGCGTSESNRKNAFETMQNGDSYLLGVGGYNGTNPNEASSIQSLIPARASSTNKLVDRESVEEMIDAKSIFIAIYDQTTYQEVMSAINDGKIVVVERSNIVYNLINASSTQFSWAALTYASSDVIARRINLRNNNVWNTGSINIESWDNKASEINSSSTEKEYPNSIAVKNYVDENAKMVVLHYNTGDLRILENVNLNELLDAGKFLMLCVDGDYYYPFVWNSGNATFSGLNGEEPQVLEHYNFDYDGTFISHGEDSVVFNSDLDGYTKVADYDMYEYLKSLGLESKIMDANNEEDWDDEHIIPYTAFFNLRPMFSYIDDSIYGRNKCIRIEDRDCKDAFGRNLYEDTKTFIKSHYGKTDDDFEVSTVWSYTDSGYWGSELYIAALIIEPTDDDDNYRIIMLDEV